MALIDYIILSLGMLTEVGVLILISQQKNYDWARIPQLKKNQTFAIALIILCLISAMTLLVTQFWNVRSQTLSPAWEEQLMISIFVAAGLFIFFYGMVLIDLLPPVNSQSIFTVNLVVLVHLISFNNWLYFGLFLLPSLGSSYVFFRRKKIPYTGQAFLYFWYLILLVHLAWISQEILVKMELTALEIYILGLSLIFLGIHLLFCLRLFLIVSSFLIPKNRPLARPLMLLLYSEQEIDSGVFWALIFVQLLILALLYFFQYSLQMLSNLFVLAMVQSIVLQMKKPKASG